MSIAIGKVTIEKLQPFAAVVHGADLSRPIPDAAFREIVAALNEHAVLVFHGQNLDDASQVAFSARFGPLEERPATFQSQQRNPNLHFQVNDLSNVDADNRIMKPGDERALSNDGNMLWHTDSSFKRVPAMASLLSAREIPPVGGETEFADMRAAWDALPEDKRRLIDGMVAEHSVAYSRSLVHYEYTAEERAAYPPVQQALVRTHPATGRKSIYVASHASRIVGWPLEEGRALLQELTEFATQPRFVYQHRWQAGDLVMWDNRCTMHRLRPFDAYRYKRIMRRTTVMGSGPTVIDGKPIAVG